MLILSHEDDSSSDFSNGKRRSASSLVPYTRVNGPTIIM